MLSRSRPHDRPALHLQAAGFPFCCHTPCRGVRTEIACNWQSNPRCDASRLSNHLLIVRCSRISFRRGPSRYLRPEWQRRSAHHSHARNTCESRVAVRSGRGRTRRRRSSGKLHVGRWKAESKVLCESKRLTAVEFRISRRQFLPAHSKAFKVNKLQHFPASV